MATTIMKFTEQIEMRFLDLEKFNKLTETDKKALVNILFFMDNNGQEFLFQNGFQLKVIRTKKLDLGFVLMVDYNNTEAENLKIVEFLNENPSYWEIEDDKIKVNKKLVLPKRQSNIDTILTYFLINTKDYMY